MNKFIAQIQVIDIYKILWKKAYNNAVNNLQLEEEPARQAANIFAINHTWQEYNEITKGIKDAHATTS